MDKNTWLTRQSYTPLQNAHYTHLWFTSNAKRLHAEQGRTMHAAKHASATTVACMTVQASSTHATRCITCKCHSYATSSASRHRRLKAAQSRRVESQASCAYCSIARPRSSSRSSSRSLWKTCAAAGMLSAALQDAAVRWRQPPQPAVSGYGTRCLVLCHACA